MTTRANAEALLFDEAPVLNTGVTIKATRRRVQPTYCPRCTGCGVEARP